MNIALSLAVALAHSWVGVYTRGLPGALRDARRNEIESDLWEQQWLAARRQELPLVTAAEIAARTLLGFMSDITWRLEAGASSQTKGITTVSNSWSMRLGFIVAMIPLALLIAMGISFMLGNGDWENNAGHWIWRIFFVVCPLVGATGLWLCATRPKLGMALVLAGVGPAAFIMPWMAPLTVPFAIAIIAFAVLRAGLLPSSSPRQPAG